MCAQPRIVRKRKRLVLVGALFLCPVLAVPIVSGAAGDSGAESPVRKLSREENSVLHAAEEELLRDCMRESGFRYRKVAENPLPELRSFPHVIDDLAWAKKHGYGTDLQRKVERMRASDPNQRYFRSLSAERRAAALDAFHGESSRDITVETPDGVQVSRSEEGCQAEAERELFESLPAWFTAESYNEALPGIVEERVAGDARFAAAVRPWSRCMKEDGHDYRSPAELRKRLPSPENPLPRDKEIRLAVAEAECAHSTGLAEVTEALEQKYRKEVRRQYRSEVETGRRLQLAALPRARSVVEG